MLLDFRYWTARNLGLRFGVDTFTDSTVKSAEEFDEILVASHAVVDHEIQNILFKGCRVSFSFPNGHERRHIGSQLRLSASSL